MSGCNGERRRQQLLIYGGPRRWSGIGSRRGRGTYGNVLRLKASWWACLVLEIAVELLMLESPPPWLSCFAAYRTPRPTLPFSRNTPMVFLQLQEVRRSFLASSLLKLHSLALPPIPTRHCYLCTHHQLVTFSRRPLFRHHRLFSLLTFIQPFEGGEMSRPLSGDLQKRYWKGWILLLGYLGHDIEIVFQASECHSFIHTEMDLCREIVWNCPCDGIQYSRIEEVDKIYVSLAGLNLKFDIVHGRILCQRPVPSLMEVCSEVRLEEDRTSVMSSLTTLAIDSATFSAKSPSHGSDRHNGKPIPVLSLPASDSILTTLGAIAQIGISQSFSLIGIDGKNPWILDFGATDHLTGFCEPFMTYILHAGNEKIRIVDGSLAPIVGKGQISTFERLTLHNVP
ncbi:UBN2_3 domain-containing protein [Cucumis melo var. makuwa]|uniref:UBN2_3 domain-containing protein n=1 Tax=Cucumis melo var. makuwa TaxID=1194695 RepID=A0A5D3CQJ6_CUCMM|nr:UBN2_3 domain-containing protein [Cucumis melo var. makuwa]